MTAITLKPGQKLRIAGIDMEFSYFQNQHPVFIHFVDGKQYAYVNKKYNKSTPIHEIS